LLMNSLIIPEIALDRYGLFGIVYFLLAFARRDDDQELIRQVQNGNQRAFEKLVVRFQKEVYYLARKIVFNHMDADEVVQDTFLKVYRNIKEYDPDKCKFFTWLYRITVNTALSFIRRRPERNQSIDSLMEADRVQFADAADVTQEYQNHELQEIIEKALDSLSPEMRSVFILKTWNGLSYKEIAEVLEISEGTVMSRLNRARSKLQLILKETGGYK
jgi:RNA polymerase sigma-70 factor, ECF subfamily